MASKAGNESGSINQNTNTSNVVEPIQMGAGEGFTSFDQLESVVAKKATEKAQEPPAEPKESKPSKDSEKAEKSEDKQEDEKLDQEEEKSASKKDTDKAAKENDKDQALKDLDEKVKIYKIKQGESELALRADTEVEVIVNGKKEKAQIQELMNNYSGRTHIAREFSKLKKEQQAYEKDRGEVQQAVNEVYAKVTSDKPLEAFTYLAEIMGADPVEVLRKLKTQIEPLIEQRLTMSPAERALIDKEEELSLYQKREQQAKTKQSQQAELKQVESAVEATLTEYGMEMADFAKAYESLVQTGSDLSQVTPKKVAEHFKAQKEMDSLGSLLTEINPELPNKGEVVDQIRELMQVKAYKSFTLEDWRDVLTERYGNQKAKNLSRKLQKAKPANTSRPKVSQSEDAWTFDQIQ